MSSSSIPRDAMNLTRREGDVVDLMLAGLSNKQMARMLGISPASVRTHVAAAYRRLGVRSRAALSARIAQRAGVDLRAHFNRLRRHAEVAQINLRG